MKRLLSPRTANEYLVLIIRFFFLMVFYTFFRIAFYRFNKDMFPGISGDDLVYILYGGLKFDISAIVYLNLLYIVLFLLPLKPGFKFGKQYQNFLKWIFVIFNSIGFALNSIDIIYYRFILKRTTYNVKDILANEHNLWKLSGRFIVDYWYIAILFVLFVVMLSYAYSFVIPKPVPVKRYWHYAATSIMALFIFTVLSVAGIRGGFRHSTRPIAISNAGKYVKRPEQMSIVLNTPFTLIRNWGHNSYKHRDYFKSDKDIEKIFDPVFRADSASSMNKKNVVIFILESFNREYSGALNHNLDGGKYKGFTPFLDSLMNEGWTFIHAYANGRKSIDAMPSIIASIPALVIPYVISEYSTNHINSLAGLLRDKGYDTGYFHGAPNGSMGFDSFANVAGFDHYVGKTEYNNDDDFDGWWGIWDHKFFPFFARELDKMKQPFFATLFSLSSHHPFMLPKELEGKYPKGYLPVHQCIGYSDDALRNFFSIAKRKPWYKNTLFVITADHSTISHFKESQTNLGAFAIPLLFYAPGDTAFQKKKDERLAQQIDIMPTVLDYLGYDSDYLAFGSDLYKDRKTGVINYIDGYYQYITDSLVLYFDGEKVTGVYNYNNDHYLEIDIKDSVDYSKLELEVKAIVQQYNNRMLEDRLLPNNQ